MNLEFNKLFAALLVAGITAGMSSFVARKIIHPHDLKEDAVPIEGVEVVAGAASKPKGPEPILHLVAAADVARGQKLSKACAACHSFDKGGPNRVGPNLWNVMGEAKASKAGFAYSDALKEMSGAWGYPEMNKFLYKPKVYVPGTKMNYIGLKKPEDRAAMIAWMRTLHDSPLVFPSEAEIAAEKAELAPEEAIAPEEEMIVPETDPLPSDIDPAAGDEEPRLEDALNE